MNVLENDNCQFRNFSTLLTDVGQVYGHLAEPGLCRPGLRLQQRQSSESNID